MKVGVNSSNKPLPLSEGSTAGLISGAGSVGGSLVGGLFNLIGAKQQRKHDKEMAKINQDNILSQMEQQNQYQIDQWNRENEYNDPSAVAARYRAAGISPQAALGGSASGAGVAGGLSSAPSGSSTGSASHLPSPGAGLSLGNIGHNVVQAMAQAETNNINRERMEAESEKTYQEAKKVALDVQEKEFMRDAGVWQNKVSEEKSKSKLLDANSVMASIRALNYDRENRADVAQKEAAVDEMRKKIEHYDALINQIEELTPAEKAQLLALADKYREDAREVKASNDYFEKVGYRPGMNLEQALVSIAGKVAGIGIDSVKKWLEGNGLTGKEYIQLPPTAEQQIRAALDEFDREERKAKNSDRDAYGRYRFRLIDNLARSFKY